MRLRSIVWCLVLSAASAAASAQNAVLNPDFDTDTANWVLANPSASTPGAVFERDADSGSGSPLGAANLVYSRPTGAAIGEVSIWTLCMAATGNTMLEFGGQVQHATNPVGSTVNLILLMWTDGTCTAGQTVAPGAPGTTVPGTVDGAGPVDYTRWTGSTTTGAGVQSMRILVANSPGADDTLSRALWDRLFVGPPGTTPVELQEFDVD
jgi:hypothetical protein